MQCKVYTGHRVNNKPVKIVCSNFNVAIDTTKFVRFGFWVKNPVTTVGLAIPI